MKPVEEKAIRLVLDDRVTVGWATGDGVAASGKVDGETDTYQVSYSPSERVCTCPAGRHHRTCSHVLALELAVAREVELVDVG